MLTYPTGLFSRHYISAPRGAGPEIFTRPTSPVNCISSRTWGAGGPHVGLCPIFLVLVSFDIFVSGYLCWIKLTTFSFLVHVKLFYRIVSYSGELTIIQSLMYCFLSKQ